jgi:putative hydrolase of the HAD superfamily
VTALHLLIDADDTLWENNIYFEQAFAQFCDFLDHSPLSAVQVRAILDEIELVNSRVHGYGSLNFGRNLRQCYQRLAERDVDDDDLNTITGFAERILESPMEVIDGVAPTLEYLAARHDLTLFTKGHPEEQKLKIDRSGLGRWFGHTAIVKEKDAPSYRRIVEERSLVSERTWMIGNSPKSDINPALETGLNAVLVPHEHTWRLEHEAVGTPAPGRRLVTVEKFADLMGLF